MPGAANFFLYPKFPWVHSFGFWRLYAGPYSTYSALCQFPLFLGDIPMPRFGFHVL
jgi:hypothetical protein